MIARADCPTDLRLQAVPVNLLPGAWLQSLEACQSGEFHPARRHAIKQEPSYTKIQCCCTIQILATPDQVAQCMERVLELDSSRADAWPRDAISSGLLGCAKSRFASGLKSHVAVQACWGRCSSLLSPAEEIGFMLVVL